ncbi:ATP-binding response regulator [Azohydromonas aeria]|uniref:ATP-binding response regulator n=1 Tax=Azohydromonas aeria TaxID=2590212 RepID=UPI001E2A5377|nr:ATP-binding protein [Azohydromonas aeria]
MAAGVFLGRVLMALLLGGTFGTPRLFWSFELWMACAVTLQALLAAWLVRRCLLRPGWQDRVGSVLALVAAAGPASCWVAPLLGVPALVAMGRTPADGALLTAYRWWAGDSIAGVLLVPLLLAALSARGFPRQATRRSMSMPLLWTACLVTALLYTLAAVERRKAEERFFREAHSHADALAARLQTVEAFAQILQAQPQAEPLTKDEASQQRLRRLLPPGAQLHWLADDTTRHGAALQGLLDQVRRTQQTATLLLPDDGGLLAWAAPGPGSAHVTVPVAALLPLLPTGARLQRCLFAAGSLPTDAACHARQALFQRDVDLPLPGLVLTLRESALSDYVVQDAAGNFQNVYLLALLGSTCLVSFILVAKRHTARVEEQVVERTRALRRSEARLQGLFDAALVGIQYLGPDGRIERMNPESRRLCGVDEHAPTPLLLRELLHPGQREDIERLLRSVVAGRACGCTREVRLCRADGQETDVLLRLASVLEPGGDGPLPVVAVLVDLTDFKKLQAAEQAREVAETTSRAKDDFLSRMSHELRTPLNAILGFAQLLHGRLGDDAPARQQLAHIERAGWHLLAMINDILDLSRIESGQMAFELEDVPLARAVQDSVALLEGEARGRQVGLDVQLPVAALAVRADATRLRQVLLNLLSNAIKYNHPNGRVTVRLVQQDGYAGVAVEDTGPGLDAQALRQLFTPFNRLGWQHSDVAGTGLGLVVARQIAQGMGGRIDVASTPGAGSTFTAWFRAAEAMERPAVGTPSGPETSLPGMAGSVLCVEDNEVNVEVMKAIFATEPGVRLSICGTGADALAQATSTSFDIILLDLGLPDMDGVALLRRLREATPRSRIIVVSADASPATQQEVVQAGAHGCLPKPYDVLRLRAAVGEGLARSAKA